LQRIPMKDALGKKQGTCMADSIPGEATSGPGLVAVGMSGWQAATKTGVRIISKNKKQSRVPNVIWSECHGSWQVWYRECDRKQACKRFALRRYMNNGCTFEEADKCALQAAIAFRAELVEKGVLKEATVKEEPAHFSDVRGVTWQNKQKRWCTAMSINGQRKQACFKPENDTFEAVQRARQDAEEQRKIWECESGLIVAQVQV